MPEHLRSIAGRQATLLVALVTGLVATLARLLWLDSSPPGFSLAEARATLAAQDLSAGDLLLPRAGLIDSQEPLFSYLLWLTGSLAGWDVTGARLAAALLGIVAAIACALWYRRTLGPLAGLAGGLLVATSFPWLVLSRQAQHAIGAGALAALGLWCLWEGLGPRDRRSDMSHAAARQRGWWIVAAGICFGLGLSAHPAMLPALVVAPASGVILIWRSGHDRHDRPARTRLIAGLTCLLLLATPMIVRSLSDPDALRQRLEQDWNGDGQVERLADPIATIAGYSESLFSIGWNGHDAATLGTPGQPLLDPLLLIWSLAGLVVVVTRPLAPLHSLTLLWLIGFGLPAALLDPGNPALLTPLAPVLFLLPLIGLHASVGIALSRGRSATRLALVLTAATIAGSIAWSLVDYRAWSRSDTTYFAFNADLREALSAVDRLRPGSIPVYIATTPETAPLRDYLGPAESNSGRVQRPIDTRTTLVIPADGIGYLVTTASNPLPEDLGRLLEGPQPAETGETPGGATAWQIWIVGQAARERLPWTLPALGFPDEFNLAGFDIRPDLGDIATTGQLPDPPRVLVTLVWDVPRGATPHIARVRLVPTTSATGDPEQNATLAETWLTASPPIAAGNRGRELVVVRMSVLVPDSPDLIVEVQAGLSRASGTALQPTDAGASAAGDFVLLNRVQYVPDSNAGP